jgi:hypothetical protein
MNTTQHTRNQCFQLAYAEAISQLQDEYGSGLEYTTRNWEPSTAIFNIDCYAYEESTFEDAIEMMGDAIYEELEDYILSGGDPDDGEEGDMEGREEENADCPNPHQDCQECRLCMD